jgi:hypothetical protein
MYYAAKEFQTSELDTVANVIGLTPSDPLNTFAGKYVRQVPSFLVRLVCTVEVGLLGIYYILPFLDI